MKMNKLIVMFFVVLNFAFGQEVHEHPDHPKGTSAAMYQALPFYNEACEYYAKGLVLKAKKSLYQSINISFELTEAQLFLADIYYMEGKIDSAFYFYNSGIDFNIGQKPHYYFRLFETGQVLGQYAKMKHCIGHFNKLYSQLGGEKPYEEGYPYTRTDLEYYEGVIAMVYNYIFWKPVARFEASFSKNQQYANCIKNSLVLYSEKGVFRYIHKKGGYKKREVKGIPDNARDIFITDDGTIALYCLEMANKSLLYLAHGNGKKFQKGILLPKEVNGSTWQGTPFLTKDHKTLYFSAAPEGNKDLFVAQIDISSIKVSKVNSLNRLNTPKDEHSLFFDEVQQIFYFSSNGRIGFGGFDVFYCKHYEVIDDLYLPFDPQNIGATFNSNQDEISLRKKESDYVLERKNKAEEFVEIYTPLPLDEFDYNLKLTNLSEN